MSNVSDLERAIAVAEGVAPEVGYDVLLAACKRYVRAARGPQPCPSCGQHMQGAHYCVGKKPNNGGWKQFYQHYEPHIYRQGVPPFNGTGSCLYCGLMGPHDCAGANRITCNSESNYKLVGSGDDLNLRGMGSSLHKWPWTGVDTTQIGAW